MPDATLHLSRLRRALDLHTPTLCRYDVTVTYKGDKNTHLHKELPQTTIFTRLLIDGYSAQVEQCRRFVGVGAETANFFTIPPTPTQFAFYIGFKSPYQEGTLLECKFSLPRFVQGGWTWDIVGSKVLQDVFRISLEIHFLMDDRRIDLSHDTKTGTTSLRIFTSSDPNRGSVDMEKRLLQKLVDSPASKARTDALIANGNRLIPYPNGIDQIQYLDLSIQALSAGCPYIQNRSSSLRSAQAHRVLCHLLFLRCTFPEGGLFVERAFDALKGLGIISGPDDGFEESFIHSILLVLEKHARPDHVTLTFRVLTSPICALARNPLTSPKLLIKAAMVAVQLAPGSKETYTILDNTLPITASFISPDQLRTLLICKAIICISLRFDGIDFSHDVVIAAIDSVRNYCQRHDVTVMNRDFLCDFLYHATCYLRKSVETTAGLQRILSFLDWAISLGLEIEPGGSDSHLIETQAHVMVSLWLKFAVAMKGVADEQGRWCMKELIQLVYSKYRTLGDDLTHVIEEQLLYLGIGMVIPSKCGLPEGIDDFLKYSLSTKPQDHMGLIRVVIAATIARSFGLPIAMKGYQLLISSAELFDFEWIKLSSRDGHLVRDLSIPDDAVSYALASGYHTLALEWIDQGYGLVWRRIMGFRSSFTPVAAVDPKLVEELTEVSTKLLGSPNGGSSEDEERYHFSYTRRWHDAISKVRKLPGLDRFLKPKTFAEIQSVADELGGPVVYLTINRSSCDALCILPDLGDSEVVHIPLPHLRPMQARTMTIWFRHLLDGTGTEEVHLDADSLRLGKLVQDPKLSRKQSVRREEYVSFHTVLEFLWRNIVKPILDGLAIPRSESTKSTKKLPRLWWCPCTLLEALPFHAAGLYKGDNEDNIMNYVVSSYIPSPSLASHITRVRTTTPNLRFLAVANPSGCGLPGTKRELEIIRKHIADAGPLTELVGASATPNAVKQGLQIATWVHFACHGVNIPDIPGKQGPMDSSLILANRARLSVLEISKLALPQAQFAFLSACETAQEGPQCFGESPHLAAAMLVAGFRSVVGTMWRISDYYAPHVADHFYQKVFEGNQVPDYRRSAYALHDAVKALRAGHNPDFHIWVPFCHYGA